MMDFKPYKEEYERLKYIAERGRYNARTNPIGCILTEDLAKLWVDYNAFIAQISKHEEFEKFVTIIDQNEIRQYGDGKFKFQAFDSITHAFEKMDIIIQNETL